LKNKNIKILFSDAEISTIISALAHFKVAGMAEGKTGNTYELQEGGVKVLVNAGFDALTAKVDEKLQNYIYQQY